jgi:hypothetical protein
VGGGVAGLRFVPLVRSSPSGRGRNASVPDSRMQRTDRVRAVREDAEAKNPRKRLVVEGDTHGRTTPEFDSTIAEYYRQAPEERRLEQGPFLLEALRTRELIERHAPAAPAIVLDLGGAAGAYALWLADAGLRALFRGASGERVTGR